MSDVNLFPPVTEYFRKVEAFFRRDSDVNVQLDYDTSTIDLYVKGNAKATALDKVLAHTLTFGNQVVNINVIPDNEADTLADVYRDAFSGNPAVELIHVSEGPVLMGATYVLFAPEVVQYEADDIGDLNGIHSTLYQDLAEELFEVREGVFFNTSPVTD